MLEQNMIEQLKEVFSRLEGQIELVMDSSEHEKQVELETLLNQVASTSSHINLKNSGIKSNCPSFGILYNGKANGIRFAGIPGGHEFSSLILAILNSDGKGKIPDEFIKNKIKSLKGPISVRTFVSLSCENCPDVVQALNLMAILKEDFDHEMVDGEFFQDEIRDLKIQGVPAVVSNNELISSGKTVLIELIEKLEKKFGTNENQNGGDLGQYDVVIVGGGPSGSSAAIYAARKGLKTAVIADRIGGQLQDTKGIENFISVVYTEGPQLSASLLEHMKKYDIDLLEHRRVKEIVKGDLHKLYLSTNEEISTKGLIISTGAKWRELGVEGEKEYRGRGVAYCPHCDGPYYKGQDVAVIGGGNSGVEAAIDLAGIVKSVTLIEFAPELRADSVLVEKLKSLPNTKIIKNARTNKVVGNGDKVVGLEYEDRADGTLHTLELAGVFVQIGLVPNSEFLKGIVELTKFGEVVIDNKCRTSEKGIYAAGDVTTVPFKQIIIAMGEGAKAGLSAFEDIALK